MTNQGVPKIFSGVRRAAREARARTLRARPDAARWLLDEMHHDLEERIAFMQLEPKRKLVIDTDGAESLDEERPLPGGPYELIAYLGKLDTVNDLPGALLHALNALDEGGIFIASMVGAGSLPMLRQIMLAADGEKPAARVHPQVDNRAATALLERAGFARQVVDSATLKVSYRSLERHITDLREQGLTNVLADSPPPLTREALARAQAAFDALKDEEGRVTETFEILTLTGWR